jgi:lipoate-protein ligase A
MEWDDIRQVNVAATTVQEQLIWDEYLLRVCEEGQIGPSIRTWVAGQPAVVLGYSNNPDREVLVEACLEREIPVLRRTSGGGTVLLDSGCLNYSLVLPISYHASLASVSLTNQFIMRKQCCFLKELVDQQVDLKGDTDLVVDKRKVSGNAQRRGRSATLFHGSFLCSADLELIGRILAFPSRQPTYRKGREHSQFLSNLGISVSDLSQSMLSFWVGNNNRVENLAPNKDVWADCCRRLKLPIELP